MDTATAAEQAKVSIATIRRWCRIGAVAATKRAGRWVIDAASLAYRISLGVRRTTRKIVYTVENMIAIGGSEWERHGKHRVYLNNWAELAGLEVDCYKSGNIRSAAYRGESISNSQAYKILGSIDKVWFDAADGQLYCRYGWSESRVADRAQVWADVVAGVRAAIAAL